MPEYPTTAWERAMKVQEVILRAMAKELIKQSHILEDLRVLSYQRLQNLVALVARAAYFAATFLGQKLKLRLLTEKLLIISLRFFGIPPFRFHALAEGIRKVLSQGRPPTTAPPPDSYPLQLFLAWHG